METVFLKVLNMSLTASLLIVAVIVLRFLLKNAPKRMRCLLWILVAVRLVCPFSVESVFGLIPAAEPIPQTITTNVHPQIETGIPVVNQAIKPVLSDSFSPSPEASVNPLQVYVFLASVVWMIGIAVLLLYGLISYLTLYKKVKPSVCAGDRIKVCDDIQTPFILGIFRPDIYIPSGVDDKKLDSIIAHENAHIKRKDYLWKPLGFLIMTVHWFNPLVWVSYILLCRDIELACDEKVIRDMSKKDSAFYMEALLACSITDRRSMLVCPLAFGEVGVKQRIKSILNYEKPSFWIILVSTLVCIATAICFLTTAPTDVIAEADTFDRITLDEPAKTDALEGTSFDYKEALLSVQNESDSAGEQTYLTYEQLKENTVYIKVQPSIIRDRLDYFYKPTGEDQTKLMEWMNMPHESWEKNNRPRMKLKETGWTVWCNDIEYRAFNDGYFICYEDGDEYVRRDEEVYQVVCRLMKEIGYDSVDITKIKDIVSATLKLTGDRTGNEMQTMVITDKEILSDLESWFCEAEYISGGADCGNQYACLELAMANDKTVRLSLSTDSCPNFGANGVYYDYRPSEYRGKDGWYSDDLFRLFDSAQTQVDTGVIAYLGGITEKELIFDRVEWVDVPGKRASELGITEDDAPSGFYVYNLMRIFEKAPISSDCKITVLNRNRENFASEEISLKEFTSLLNERDEQDAAIAYMITFKDGSVVKIEEYYVPWEYYILS